MIAELTLKVSKNKATGKCFIFLEKIADRNQITLINPDGKVLTVPAHIFDEPITLHSTDFEKNLTNEQLQAYDKAKKGKPKTTRKKSTTTRKKKAAKKGSKKGLGATWSAPKLSFFKFNIDPLDDTQSFRINLEDGRVFEIEKGEFLRVFSDAAMSFEYSREGSYSYDTFPEKAEKYLKTPAI